MKNDVVYNLWTNFINNEKYSKYFRDDNEIWIDNLSEVKKFIKENNKKPTGTKLSLWITRQNYIYDIDINKCKYIMKDNTILNHRTFADMYF